MEAIITIVQMVALFLLIAIAGIIGSLIATLLFPFLIPVVLAIGIYHAIKD